MNSDKNLKAISTSRNADYNNNVKSNKINETPSNLTFNDDVNTEISLEDNSRSKASMKSSSSSILNLNTTSPNMKLLDIISSMLRKKRKGSDEYHYNKDLNCSLLSQNKILDINGKSNDRGKEDLLNLMSTVGIFIKTFINKSNNNITDITDITDNTDNKNKNKCFDSVFYEKTVFLNDIFDDKSNNELEMKENNPSNISNISKSQESSMNSFLNILNKLNSNKNYPNLEDIRKQNSYFIPSLINNKKEIAPTKKDRNDNFDEKISKDENLINSISKYNEVRLLTEASSLSIDKRIPNFDNIIKTIKNMEVDRKSIIKKDNEKFLNTNKKEKADSIRKRIKCLLNKFLLHKLNYYTRDYGNTVFFLQLPKKMSSCIKQDYNTMIFNLTIKQLLSLNTEDDKDKIKVEHNTRMISIINSPDFLEFLNKKYYEVFFDYINSKEFIDDMIEIKKKECDLYIDYYFNCIYSFMHRFKVIV